MAIKFKTTSGASVPKVTYLATASTTYTDGSLLYRDTTAGTIKEATASVGITTNIEAVGIQTVTTASGTVYLDALPIYQGMLFVVDCTNTTAVNQLNKVQAMTDARTVANTSTHIATTLGVFMPVALYGSLGTQLLGYFIKLSGVAA